MNKTEKALYHIYLNTTCESVFTAYKKPSQHKINIEKNIKFEMCLNNGYNYRITEHNCYFFSCAYVCYFKGKKFLMYHTPTKLYKIVIE